MAMDFTTFLVFVPYFLEIADGTPYFPKKG